MKQDPELSKRLRNEWMGKDQRGSALGVAAGTRSDVSPNENPAGTSEVADAGHLLHFDCRQLPSRYAGLPLGQFSLSVAELAGAMGAVHRAGGCILGELFRDAPPSARGGVLIGAGLIAEGLAGLESVRDALLGLALATERDEGFAFEVEDVLFAYDLRRGERAAGQNAGEGAGDDGVVLRNIFSAQHAVDGQLSPGEKFSAEDANLSRPWARDIPRAPWRARFPSRRRRGDRGSWPRDRKRGESRASAPLRRHPSLPFIIRQVY